MRYVNVAFVTIDFATLLYTYISRFSVNPQHQQKRKIRQSCHHNSVPANRFSLCFSASFTNGPHLLSRVKVDTYLPALKETHTRAHTPKHGPSHHRPQCGFAPLAKLPPKEQPGEADTRLWRVSAFSGVAAPLGCVVLLLLSVQGDLPVWKDLTKRSGRVTITRNNQAASRLTLVRRPL